MKNTLQFKIIQEKKKLEKKPQIRKIGFNCTKVMIRGSKQSKFDISRIRNNVKTANISA